MKKIVFQLLILAVISSFTATAQEIVRENASENVQILLPTDIRLDEQFVIIDSTLFNRQTRQPIVNLKGKEIVFTSEYFNDEKQVIPLSYVNPKLRSKLKTYYLIDTIADSLHLMQPAILLCNNLLLGEQEYIKSAFLNPEKKFINKTRLSYHYENGSMPKLLYMTTTFSYTDSGFIINRTKQTKSHFPYELPLIAILIFFTGIFVYQIHRESRPYKLSARRIKATSYFNLIFASVFTFLCIAISPVIYFSSFSSDETIAVYVVLLVFFIIIDFLFSFFSLLFFRINRNIGLAFITTSFLLGLGYAYGFCWYLFLPLLGLILYYLLAKKREAADKIKEATIKI